MSQSLPTAPGSTLTPSSVRAPKVDTTITKTDTLILNSVDVTDVTHDPADGSAKKLPSALALSLLTGMVEKELSDVQHDLTSLYFSPVISDPCLSPYFDDEMWGIESWERDQTSVFFFSKEKKDRQARLKINGKALPKAGTYFFDILIESLPSGQLEIRNEKNTLLNKVTVPGFARLDAVVEDLGIANFEIVLSQMDVGHMCRIAYVNLYHIKESFIRYANFLVTKMVTGGISYVTQEEFAEALRSVTKYPDTVTSRGINPVSTTTTQMLRAAAYEIPSVPNMGELGSIITLLTEHTSDDTLLRLDGRVYPIADYPRLYNYARGMSMLMTYEQWLSDVAVYGYCNNFFIAQQDDCFGLPKLKVVDGQYKYIKAR